MKEISLLFVLVFASLSVYASKFNLYAINPFSISKTISGHSGTLPFGLRTLNPENVHDGPILILTPDFVEKPNTKILHSFFVPKGMSSLGLNSKFEGLHNSFHEFKLSGLILFPGSFSDRILAQSEIQDITTPDSFKAPELLQFMENPTIPVVYIAPTEVFDEQYLLPLNLFAVFSFQNDQVILSESFGTFYYPYDQGNVDPVALKVPYEEVTQQPNHDQSSFEIVTLENISREGKGLNKEAHNS